MMTYALKSHRLQRDGMPVTGRATPNKGGPITPTVIVRHDTAGRLDHEGSVAWLCDKVAKASAHFVIGRGGEIVQLAPTNVATWHAGQSNWRGKTNANGFSIGIEIVNPGIMQRTPAGEARAWFGQTFEIGKFGIEVRSTPEHGSGFWMPYTTEQIEVVSGVCGALAATYSTITDITTHWAISPGRKVDPNPLFPLEQVRGRVFGRADAPAGDGNDAATTVGINMRRWPSLAENVIRVLPTGSRVRTIRSGIYTNAGEAARWFLVDAGADAGEGWVHGSYLALDR
jgi:N-acetylmuramoyl-L-alanine amidase